jgi:hypothetical protein
MPKSKVEKDPALGPTPQVPCVYQYPQPPELKNFDEAYPVNPRPAQITDPMARVNFQPPPIPDLDFSRKRKGGK